MIYTIGDSHCYCTFEKIKNIITNHVGPVTMKRVGYPEETLIMENIQKLNLLPDDVIILCFGEIDIRCYIKPNLIRKNITLNELLEEWVNRYLNEVYKLQLPEKIKIFIMSVVPPSSYKKSYNSSLPVEGTDQERSLYTKEINSILEKGCKQRNLGFFDIYSKYKDENGMLREVDGDSSVHIANTKYVKELLIELNLLKT